MYFSNILFWVKLIEKTGLGFVAKKSINQS